ncbi:hypothetical protein RUM44_002201 [Polyplax serrata]|uniref:Uncharacterized protein n=1 Tax=Polyplax serrata TaxID=468196 RepID=A0ABR1AM68_POLSC
MGKEKFESAKRGYKIVSETKRKQIQWAMRFWPRPGIKPKIPAARLGNGRGYRRTPVTSFDDERKERPQKVEGGEGGEGEKTTQHPGKAKSLSPDDLPFAPRKKENSDQYKSYKSSEGGLKDRKRHEDIGCSPPLLKTRKVSLEQQKFSKKKKGINLEGCRSKSLEVIKPD